MKKVLLGTTALVAAAAFAGIGVAQADDEMMAEPISISVGGYYTAAIINADAGDDDRGHGIQQNNEFNLSGSTMLDNGLSAGVRARLTTNDYEHSDEREVFFSGGFGAIHMGNIEGAAQQNDTWVPGASAAIGGIKSPWFGGAVGGGWTTNNIMNEDATKIVFFAPSFNGLGIAVSYAPEDSTDSYADRGTNDSHMDEVEHEVLADGSVDHVVDSSGQQNSEQISASLSYSMDVGGGSVSANIGTEMYTAEADADGNVGDDPSAMRYGLVVSIDQIAIGGSIHEQDMGATTNTYSSYGISWSEGPLMVGVQHGSAEEGEDSTTQTAFNINYNMGPGVDLGLQVANVDEDGGNSYSQILLGTWFAF